MHRPSEALTAAGRNRSWRPTPVQGTSAVAAIAALAFILGADGDANVAIVENRAAPARAELASRDVQVSDPTTSAPIANPFSTFLQEPARDGVTAAASGEPPRPFVFEGVRDEGGVNVLVLSQEGRSVPVQGTGMLNDSYEVESIDERQIVLLHLPSMSRQVLPVPPQESAPARVAKAPFGLTLSDSEAEN